MNASRREATLRELRLRRALEGLDPAEERELVQLGGESPDAPPDEWERAAAAAHLALLGRRAQPMPEHLRARLVDSARTILPAMRENDTPE